MAASTSQMGRFETEWLATDDNLAALSALYGVWIDRVTNTLWELTDIVRIVDEFEATRG